MANYLVEHWMELYKSAFAWSRLWKRAAKNGRKQLFLVIGRWGKAQADADRRGELLQRAYDALRIYTLSHGTPHTQFIDELADELGNPPDSNQPYKDALAKELADAKK